MSGYVADPGGRQHPLGALTSLCTSDGSLSLHSSCFDEAFHSSAGALAEAKAKFVAPAQVRRFRSGTPLRVLDVCVGLGYNSAALMAELPLQGAPDLQWWGLELDPRPLTLALQHQGFSTLWPAHVLQRLEALRDHGHWTDASCGAGGRMLWGDARTQLKQLPKGLGMDLILMDAFSPGRCPQLWSEEFLAALAAQLAQGGRLLTYSRAAAVRASLRRAGLELRSLLPAPGQRQEWSSGTLAERQAATSPLAKHGPGWQSLSLMEEEHLNTRAAIAYRDPTGQDTALLIHQRRQAEQQACHWESTSSWQRRWAPFTRPQAGT
ncbi:MnmC family methyltransferase [Synechococcus sp. UW140]|uniref:MnmC family methyltransferase n=1 Tax=Synechococcus sp. UW140 TaxID=368503 RepID=UPI001FCBF249|nr:MnmC family methyltransferase [Synechococcus sp. UW140]